MEKLSPQSNQSKNISTPKAKNKYNLNEIKKTETPIQSMKDSKIKIDEDIKNQNKDELNPNQSNTDSRVISVKERVASFKNRCLQIKDEDEVSNDTKHSSNKLKITDNLIIKDSQNKVLDISPSSRIDNLNEKQKKVENYDNISDITTKEDNSNKLKITDNLIVKERFASKSPLRYQTDSQNKVLDISPSSRINNLNEKQKKVENYDNISDITTKEDNSNKLKILNQTFFKGAFDNLFQQDAHEFLNYLLNTCGDILKAEIKDDKSLVTLNKKEILDSQPNKKNGVGISANFNTLPNLNNGTSKPKAKNNQEVNNGSDNYIYNNNNSFIPNSNRSSNQSIPTNNTSVNSSNDSCLNQERNSTEETWIHELFQGILVNETKCLNCESVSSKDENFLDLSVDVEQNTSLSHCLQEFSSTEMLCGECKYYCDNCSSKQEAEKR